MVYKKTVSIFAPAFEANPFSRGFPLGVFFEIAFFCLLTYTLQLRQASTSAWRRRRRGGFSTVPPSGPAFKRRYPFNLLGRLFAGFNDPRFQVGLEHSRHEESCSRGKSPGWVNHRGRLTVPRRWVPLVFFSWSHGRYDTGRPFPFPSFFFGGAGETRGHSTDIKKQHYNEEFDPGSG